MNAALLKRIDVIMEEIDDATQSKNATKSEAKEALEDIQSQCDSRIDALNEEMAEEEE